MVKNILDCIKNSSDFEISSGKDRLDVAAQLLLNRPDIHWLRGKPDPNVKSPDFASPAMLAYDASEIGLRAEDGQVDFISIGETDEDLEMMEALNVGISELAEKLFGGTDFFGHVYFSPGTLLGKVPPDISAADLMFSMALFRYVHRSLNRVVAPDRIHPDVEFDLDEFETVLLFFLTMKLDEEDVDFSDVADDVVRNWG
jgi:hypothetical protein